MTSGIEVRPERVDSTPGEPVTVVVEVTNLLAEPRQFQVRVVGSDSGWSGPTMVTPLLQPGAHTATELTVTLPLGFPSGEHLLGVEAVPLDATGAASTDQHQRRVSDLVVSVGSLADLHAVLEPRNVRGKRMGRIGSALSPRALVRSRGSGVRRSRGGQATVSLRNRGFEPIHVSLAAHSPGEELDISFDRSEALIDPGHIIPVSTKVKGKRPWFGRPRRTPFTVTARGTGNAVTLDGSFSQSARIHPAMLKGTAILAVLAVWASTLFFVWDEVVVQEETEETTAEQAGDVTDAPGDADGGGGAGGGSGNGTGGGAGGGADGGGGDGATDVQVGSRIEASGQVEAREPEGVQVRIRSVSLVDEISDDATFQANMRTAQASGVKLFGRRGGVIHNRIVPAQLSTSTDDEGRWAASGLGGPGFYEIRFSKPGYATKAYVVEMAEDGSPITLDAELVAGDGALSGIISGPGGPLGDAEITVTDGDVTFSTTTPTTGAVGTWGVEGLTTPGTYLITASRQGFGTATALVRLGGGESRNGVSMRLEPGVGAITGSVRSSAGPLGDITVTATNGDVTRSTTSLTEGPVGTFSITDLPMPDTYTLTIEGDGYLNQTRDVVLNSGQANVGIEMIASTGIVYGRVTNSAGDPIGGAGITAVSEDNTYKNTTSPDGTYEMVGLEPGSYVIEVEEFEYHPGSTLVTLGPGTLREVDLSLTPKDSLAPEPNNSLTVSLSAPDVTGELNVTVIDRASGMEATAEGEGTINAVFDDIPAGARTLDINGDGFQETTASARVALNGANSISVTLRPLIVADFTVLGNDAEDPGSPVEGADVAIVRLSPPCGPNSEAPGCHEPLETVTDQNGEARIPDEDGNPESAVELTDGSYRIDVDHPDYLATSYFTGLLAYETNPNPERELDIDRLGILRLDVVEPENPDPPFEPQPLDGYTVTLDPPYGDDDHVHDADEHPLEIRGIPQNTYNASLALDGYNTVTLSGLSVILNNILERRATMFPSETTTGRVVWVDTGPDGNTIPIQGAVVQIEGASDYDENGDPVSGAFPSDLTDANGQFAFPNDGELGPVFGDADLTITHPDFDGPLVVSDQPVGENLGDIELAPLDGFLNISALLEHGVADPDLLDPADPADMELRFSDGPAGFDEGPYAPSSTGTEIAGWSFSSTFNHGSLAPGTYQGEITHTDASQGATFTPATFEIFIPPNQPVNEPGLVLYRQGSISGTTRFFDDPTDLTAPTPLADATVTLEIIDGGGNVIEQVDTVDSNEFGGFSFAELDTGPTGDPITYRLIAEKEGHTDELTGGADTIELALGVGQETTAQDLLLRRQASISGTVRGTSTSGGEVPLENATVSIEQNGGSVVIEVQTDEDGDFVAYGLEPKEYFGDPTSVPDTVITITDANDDYEELVVALDNSNPDVGGPLGWGEQRTITPPTLDLPVKPGTVRFSVESTAGAQDEPDGLVFTLHRTGGGDPGANDPDTACDGSSGTLIADQDDVTPDSSGDLPVYEIGELEPGCFVLYLNAPNHAPVAKEFYVQPDETRDFTGDGEGAIPLARQEMTVKGTVTLRVGSTDLDDRSGVAVQLLQDSNEVAGFDDTTDGSGNYSIADIEDGTDYAVEFRLDGYQTETSDTFTACLGQLLPATCPSEDDPTIIIDQTLTAIQHDVTVTVRSAVDGLLEGAEVRLVHDPQAADNTTDQSYPSPTGSLPTNIDGEVTFSAVVPGHYLIEVLEDDAEGGHLDTTEPYQLQIADNPDTTPEVTIEEALVTGWVKIEGSTDPSLTGSTVEARYQTAGNEVAASYTFSVDASTSLAEFEMYVPMDAASSRSYEILAHGPNDSYRSVDTATTSLSSGDTEEVATNGDPLLIEEGADITVRVREDATSSTLIDGATIQYVGPEGTELVTDGNEGDADGTANGEIDLDGLAPGDYDITVQAGDGHDAATANGVTLAHGSNGTLTIDVRAFGALRIDPNGGSGGSSFEVKLVPELSGQANPISLQDTNNSARTIDNVTTGTYDIEVCWPAFDETSGDCEPDGSSVYHGQTQATIERGSTTFVSVTLDEIQP
ncbi:MAG: carboxypeptidase regulatory-like domain-containing protein [Acidimicrobiales bacterium]|nr:carboxypeptidase regulatory-like domain-containing protein [Acidimicrobiales bacterium]